MESHIGRTRCLLKEMPLRIIAKDLTSQGTTSMNQVTLVSTRARPIQPLVETALSNELRLLEAAIRKTERRLLKFEGQYGMTSTEFVQRYENDELAEAMDFVDWIGEYRLLARLQEKADAYREIRFVH
jgi:hypothetical protein